MTMFPAPSAEDYDRLLSSVCRGSLKAFVRRFWAMVPGTQPLKWNWHLDVLCDEFQKVAERVFAGLPKENDVIFNVSPGTSKSSVVSILAPAWCWTRMPQCRIMTASHTSDLVLDLSNKSRHVIKSAEYHRLFPEIIIRPDNDSKGYFANTLGGDRYTCTVAGRSPMGFHGHLQLCLPYESRIITEDGELPIGRVVDERIKTRVLGYDPITGLSQWQEIQTYEKNLGRCISRVHFSDGTQLECTEDHPVYVIGKGYLSATELVFGDEVISGSFKLSRMREGFGTGQNGKCSASSQRQRRSKWKGIVVLQFSVLGKAPPNNQFNSLYQLRYVDLQITRTPKIKNWLDVLRSFLSCNIHERAKSSTVQQHGETVSDLRQINEGLACQTASAVLQQSVLWNRCSREEFTLASNQTQGSLWALSCNDACVASGDSGGAGEVLFAGMCQSGTLETDDREGQFQLHPWESKQRLSSGVRQNQTKDQEAGTIPLFFVQQAAEGQWQKVGCTSHRLGQNQQSNGEFGSDVYVLSPWNAGGNGQTVAVGKKIVTHVERGIRIPGSVYNIRVSPYHNYFAEGVLVHNCDDPLDPKKAASEAELRNAKDFFDAVLPGRMVDKTITTMFLIMQRLHEDDPTGYLLTKAKREGATRIRHVCLPADISDPKDRVNVSPPELVSCYGADGLMDRVRLPRSVLKERMTDGLYAFAGQYRQSPVSPGGEMFKAEWFGAANRVRAAPYHARRVLYVDKAFTVGDDSCRTAATVIAEHEGNWYVGPVWVGRWNPDERDDVILAAAQQCRDRWGPNHEPDVVIEQEPAAGIDSYRQLAKKLVGFRVHADPARVNKIQRADPWASQCAAQNVRLVEGDGTWNIAEWIREHTMFPLGRLKDLVDSAGGGFNWLSKRIQKRPAGQFKVLPVRGPSDKFAGPRLVACTHAELPGLMIEHRCVLVQINDPPFEGMGVMRNGNGMHMQPDAAGSNGPALSNTWNPSDFDVNGAGSMDAGQPPEISAELTGGGSLEVMLRRGDASPESNPPALSFSALEILSITFAALEPADLQERWESPLEPWGRSPKDLVLQRDQGKQLWRLLTRKRSEGQPEVVVFASPGGQRALSLALAVADVMHLPREQAVFHVGKPDDKHAGTEPPCQHCFEVVKASRSLVL